MRSMYVTWQQLLLRQTVHCCTRFGEMNVATAAFKDTSTLSKVCLFVGTLLTALLRSDRHGKSDSLLHGALLNLFLVQYTSRPLSKTGALATSSTLIWSTIRSQKPFWKMGWITSIISSPTCGTDYSQNAQHVARRYTVTLVTVQLTRPRLTLSNCQALARLQPVRRSAPRC